MKYIDAAVEQFPSGVDVDCFGFQDLPAWSKTNQPVLVWAVWRWTKSVRSGCDGRSVNTPKGQGA
ncbi:hypothetical protein [Streptomyces agglomeratus]|uniref:hypothetical protein n=1 Tax=Streptomyces agglomeratus TaxID=285458 RepID=UPI00114D39DD|nr:hypothetical protein [Streptomyces agglomeratus]